MSSLPMEELLARVAELQIQALATVGVTCDAKDYFYHVQEEFPYWTNRLGAAEYSSESEDLDTDTYNVIMRLVIAHLTSGYKGENEKNLITWIPVVKTYFNSREQLVTETTYPTAMDGLFWARVTSNTGFRIFESTGLSAMQIGTEFVLTALFDETIEPAYT